MTPIPEPPTSPASRENCPRPMVQAPWPLPTEGRLGGRGFLGFRCLLGAQLPQRHVGFLAEHDTYALAALAHPDLAPVACLMVGQPFHDFRILDRFSLEFQDAGDLFLFVTSDHCCKSPGWMNRYPLVASGRR